MSRAAAEVGSTANSYQILAKLASGGMAEIFLARGEGVAGVERYCVLKRILRERASDVHFVQMFLDEARLAAQLQHANVAQVYDIGKLGDSYFFTMEYVHGETVRSLLGRAQGLRRALPLSCALTIAAGTAAGLHYAHTRLGRDGKALGIVHRDVSPSNLMVSYDGSVKLVDFGVAKAKDRSQETKSGTVKGKISYLSPEQCRGRRVDRRSDLFSLGICLWEMLTTERLYKRATDFENMNAIVTEAAPLPSSRRPEIPPALDALVMRLLAKEPDERYATAEEVVESLEMVGQACGAMISTSALGRFMRELFGQRPEPWHELDSQREAGEAVTVTSEPIPRELAAPAEDAMERQLASVADLSPRQVTESIEAAELERPEPEPEPGIELVGIDATARLGKRGRPGLGFPLAAPPPTDPGIRAPGTASIVPLPPPPASPIKRAEEGTQSLPSIELVPLSSPGEPVVPAPATVKSGPVPVVPATVKSGPVPAFGPATPGQIVTSSGPHPSMSASITTSGPQLAVSARSLAALRRPSWPLYAVIGAAIVIGAISIVLIRTGPHAQEAPASVAASTAPANMAQPASGITVVPIEEPRATPPVAAAPVEAAPAPAPIAPAPVEAAPVAPAPVAVIATVPRKTGLSPQPAAPPAHAIDDDVQQRYRDGQYAQAAELCVTGHPSAERAPLCFLAACHAGDAGKARKLLAALPAGKREQLIGNCKQLGVDVAPAAPRKPTDDCAADPMACQH